MSRADTAKYDREQSHREQPETAATPVPAVCEALRQRMLHVLAMARVVEGDYVEHEQAPLSFRARMIQNMQDDVLELMRLIKLARAAVPGVAHYIDPLQSGQPGQWTMDLNKTLANLEQLLITGGFRVCSLHPKPWAKIIRDLDERQRYLAVVDYSAPQPTTSGTDTRQDDFKPWLWFQENTKVPPSRLRHSAQPGRRSKRVRKQTIDGVACYSVSDARRWWPVEMAARESA